MNGVDSLKFFTLILARGKNQASDASLKNLSSALSKHKKLKYLSLEFYQGSHTLISDKGLK